MSRKRPDPWLPATLLVLSVAFLGRALQVGDGILKPGAIRWLVLAFAACALGTLLRVPRGIFSWGATELAISMGIVLGWQLVQMFTQVPFNEVDPAGNWQARFRIGVLAAALTAGAMFLARGWLRHFAFMLLLLIFALLGVSTVRASHVPNIDVFVFQRDAALTLARGQNPYAITFPDIYGSDEPWYGSGISKDGRLHFGYPYMPLTLLLALPGEIFAGDYRYAQLTATALAAALIAYARVSLISFAAAALLLFQPRGLYIVERGWSDPFVLLPFALTVFCAIRAERWAPWTLGLFLASKQYAPFALGAAMLLVVEPFSWRRAAAMFGKAAIAASVVTLPLAMWDVRAFWNSAVMLQLRQPFRWDSLSFVSWWMDGERHLPRAAMALPFVSLLVATTAALRLCPRSAGGFAAGTALVLFSFFAFNKQAFGNYYYVVIGAMCGAIAASEK